MKKVVKLTESDLTRIVRRVINEDLDGYSLSKLGGLHDDIYYLKHAHNRGNMSIAIKLYKRILDIIGDNMESLPEDVLILIDDLNDTLSGLDGFDNKLVELYGILTKNDI